MFGVHCAYDKGFGDAGMEKFKESDGAADIDVLEGECAHLQKQLQEVVVGDGVGMGADRLDQLIAQLL